MHDYKMKFSVNNYNNKNTLLLLPLFRSILVLGLNAKLIHEHHGKVE